MIRSTCFAYFRSFISGVHMVTTTNPYSNVIPWLTEEERYSLPRTFAVALEAHLELVELHNNARRSRRALDEARDSGKHDLCDEQDKYATTVRLRSVGDARLLCAELDLKTASLRFARIDRGWNAGARACVNYDLGHVSIVYGNVGVEAICPSEDDYDGVCLLEQVGSGQWACHHQRRPVSEP